MGMDVYGIAPVTRSKAPERPENLFSLPDDEQDRYYEALDKYQEENPGVYFRANVWSWRPLVEVMEESGACYELSPKDWENMHYNSGQGAKDQAACVRMANRIKCWMTEKIWENDVYSPESLVSDDMMVSAETGRFVSPAEAELKNETVVSPYRIHRSHIESFVRFLEECGGFEVH